MEGYTKPKYVRLRSRKNIASGFWYKNAAEYFSKYPKFSEADEMAYRTSVVLRGGQILIRNNEVHNGE